ncbi:MAG: ABC transporter substrate-binding protein [Pseudomonadota bacterium]
MKIGLMLPYAGPASIWRPGSEACAYLALDENTRPGQRSELYIADCGSTPQKAADAARYLMEDREVDVVVGMQLSHQRIAAAAVLQNRLPYIYTPQYEGWSCGPGVIPVGLRDAEVLAPGIDMLRKRAGVRRWSFVGNDYLWPQQSCKTAVPLIAASGGTLVHKHFRPFDDEDFGPLIKEIANSSAEAVIVGLLGQESVRFHRAFAEAGLADYVHRFCMVLDETLLWALEEWQTRNLFACQTFYCEHADMFRDGMVSRYRSLFGETRPPVTSVSLGIYDGVRLALALGHERSKDLSLLSHGFSRETALRMLGLADASSGRQHPRVAAADGYTFNENMPFPQ